MATTSAPLNAEPADSQSRKEQNLPPKSFADAVQEEAPLHINGDGEAKSLNGANKSNGLPGINGQENAETGDGDQKSNGGHQAAILKIVDTHGEAEGKTIANGEVKKEQKEDDSSRPVIERQESRSEYSATGLDESAPKSPQRTLRKPRSKKSNSLDTSKERNGSPTPMEKIFSKSEDDTVIFEKFHDKKNGENLTSIKPNPDYERQLQRDRKESMKLDSDNKSLVSGRQAGKGWERSGIRFAPWNIPLQRRLQTLVVLFHTLCIALSVSAFFFLCAIPIFWPLLIPYLIYCLTSTASTSGTLSHRSNLLRGLPVWSLFAGYFPARLHRSQELPPTRKYIFGYHPHGIISHGAFAAFGTEALGFSQLFPGITNTLLTLDSNFRIPIYRDYALAMGLASVSRESCENLLSKGGPNNEGMGRAITIVVGGARESLDAMPYSLRLVLKRRYGFIKIALRTGSDLVPVLAFGENDLYDQFLPEEHPQIHKFQLMVKKLLGFTIPLFHARGVFNYDVGLMPYRRPLNVVVGRPIKVTRQEKPTQAELDRLHSLYMKELERLWDLWKDVFAKNRQSELQLVD